jgi:hypothetical protein
LPNDALNRWNVLTVQHGEVRGHPAQALVLGLGQSDPFVTARPKPSAISLMRSLTSRNSAC